MAALYLHNGYDCTIGMLVSKCFHGDFSGILLMSFVVCTKCQTFQDRSKHWTLSLQVGYAEKICNVWTKVAKDELSYSGRFSEAISSVLSVTT